MRAVLTVKVIGVHKAGVRNETVLVFSVAVFVCKSADEVSNKNVFVMKAPYFRALAEMVLIIGRAVVVSSVGPLIGVR